jgi:hypothetical protein
MDSLACFVTKIFYSTLKNGLAFYNDGIVTVNFKRRRIDASIIADRMKNAI